ncbi:Rv1535 domain-containing protein [Mycolicibacter minnesotensis]
MRATEVLADPLVEATAWLLTGPAYELYALLWRAGLLESYPPVPQTYSNPGTPSLQPAG